jgi:hypothetical protein
LRPARRFRVVAAFARAARLLRVVAAFRAAALRFRVVAAFFAADAAMVSQCIVPVTVVQKRRMGLADRDGVKVFHLSVNRLRQR